MDEEKLKRKDDGSLEIDLSKLDLSILRFIEEKIFQIYFVLLGIPIGLFIFICWLGCFVGVWFSFICGFTIAPYFVYHYLLWVDRRMDKKDSWFIVQKKRWLSKWKILKSSLLKGRK